MSRTKEQGLSFVPLDVDFLDDEKVKILKLRYGTDGVMILVYLWTRIYREGYYTIANRDFFITVSSTLGFSLDKVEQVVAYLVERSMFDRQVFHATEALTSTGIQERWQREIADRENGSPITVDERIWLLPLEKTTIHGVRGNYVQNSDFGQKNSDFSENDTEKEQEERTKRKRSKKKSPKEEIESLSYSAPARTREKDPPSVEEVRAYCREKGLSVDPEAFVAHYASIGWMKGQHRIQDWKATVRLWDRRAQEEEQKKAQTPQRSYRARPAAKATASSFDTDEFFQAALARSYNRMHKEEG